MFEDSLLESTRRNRTQNKWSFIASISVQAAIAVTIIIIPLLHPETIRRMALNPPELIAPIPPPPPPPQVPVHIAVRTADTLSTPAAAAPMQLVRATMHSIVDTLMRPQNGTEVPPGVAIASLPGMVSGNGPADSLGTAPTGPTIRIAAPAGPARVSSGVSAGMLLAPIHPAYPRIAVASRTEGTVVVHAIISKTGNIESATILSGPAMLQSAAIDAVRSAHYRPYLLNGQPTEVDTTINIVFHLNN